MEMVQHYDGPIPRFGAANTLYRDQNDNWWAANTDYEAALSSLRNALTEGKTALEPIPWPASGCCYWGPVE